MIQTYATGANDFAVIGWATGYIVAHLSSQYRHGYRACSCSYQTITEAAETMNRNIAHYSKICAA